jgi:hypothetical protein
MRQPIMATTESLALPIRLVPRRRPTAAWAAFWLALAMFCFLTLEYENPLATRHAGIATLIIAVAAGAGLISLMKLLPRSPFFHVRLGFDGLRVSRPFHFQHYTWSELSNFSVLDRLDQPWRRPRYVVAAFWSYQLSAAENGQQEPDVALRIDADPYGSGPAADNAGGLAEWMNELRERAALGQLDDHDEVSVPTAFRDSAIQEIGREGPPPTPPGQRRRPVVNRPQAVVRD